MGAHLRTLTIRGFKSIETLEDFKLSRLNVLIGANGAGKSNFVDFFRMLRALADEGFQNFVLQNGGGDGFFFMGPKVTPRISAHLEFGYNTYEFELAPTAGSGVQIVAESVQYTGGFGLGKLGRIGSGALESALKKRRDEGLMAGHGKGVSNYVHESVSSWTVYHFHDTSMLAPMRRDRSVRDYDQFRHDAANLAPFLLHLKETHAGEYQLVRDVVRLVAPFFGDFVLRPKKQGNEEMVRLEWKQKGSDFPFQPYQLSDGTLRFICLATALYQPFLPAAVVIDEPELGLHPHAIAILAELLHAAAQRTQVVVSTQSPILLDHFAPENVVVVNRVKGASTFERLDAGRLAEWLGDYSVGELWQKNVLSGGPTNG